MKESTTNAIHRLLEKFNNKKSREITHSRLLLKRDFDYIDTGSQLQILDAFLSSCKTDRIWAYKKLIPLWNDSFLPTIQNLWERHHEYECSWLIVRYFSESYILEHLNELREGRNYYFICKRLIHKHDFVIDKSLLNSNDYLSLLLLSQHKISDNEAYAILIEGMFHICYDIFLPETFPTRRGLPLSPLRFRDFYFKYARLKELRKSNITNIVKEWDKTTVIEMSRDSSFMKLNKDSLSAADYYKKRREIARVHLRRALRELLKRGKLTAEFQSIVFKHLIDRSPHLEALISNMSLRFVSIDTNS